MAVLAQVGDWVAVVPHRRTLGGAVGADNFFKVALDASVGQTGVVAGEALVVGGASACRAASRAWGTDVVVDRDDGVVEVAGGTGLTAGRGRGVQEVVETTLLAVSGS